MFVCVYMLDVLKIKQQQHTHTQNPNKQPNTTTLTTNQTNNNTHNTTTNNEEQP